jgi:beta-glucosidase
MIRTGLLDGPWKTDPGEVNSTAHQKLAREVAEQGIILLKNQGALLPLDASKIYSIALLGPSAQTMQMGALGSPYVTPLSSVGPLEGITKRAGAGIAIHFVPDDLDAFNRVIPSSALVPAGNPLGHGLLGEYFANPLWQGAPLVKRVDPTVNFHWTSPAEVGIPGIKRKAFSVRWTGTLIAPVTGHYELNLAAHEGGQVYLDDKEIIHLGRAGAPQIPAEVDLVAGKSYALRVDYFQKGGGALAKLTWDVPRENPYAAEIAAARQSDVAIVFVSTGRREGEGHDRPSMALPKRQDLLVQAVAAANKNTIVVLNNGAPVDMSSWIDRVPGLLEAWFPGQEGGNAIASILFGDVNPSGKLPTTLARRREDYPDYGNFPGVNGVVQYREGIYVGYRHFDRENIAPLFPFGYGLSYTTFDYGPLRLSTSRLAPNGEVSVSLDVKNSGSRAGREVVELYIHDPSPKIDKAPRELKGFAKIDLAPGETKTVTLPITARDLAYFDVPGRQWKADAGDYEIEVGASSRDIRQKAVLQLTATYTEPVPLSRDQLVRNGGFTEPATAMPK